VILLKGPTFLRGRILRSYPEATWLKYFFRRPLQLRDSVGISPNFALDLNTHTRGASG